MIEMKTGSLVLVFRRSINLHEGSNHRIPVGIGIFLGFGSRGEKRKNDSRLLEFWWKGRFATFDWPHWTFEVIV